VQVDTAPIRASTARPLWQHLWSFSDWTSWPVVNCIGQSSNTNYFPDKVPFHKSNSTISKLNTVFKAGQKFKSAHGNI
jgi:hypothetical protein